MKGVVIGLVAFGLIIFATIGIFTISYFNYAGQGVTYEENIDAQVKANQAKYSEFTQTAVEQMGIAREQRDAVAKIIKDGIEGRFGPNGSTAMVQAFNEAYPAKFDGALYGKIMQTVEAGRRDFTAEQKMLISKVQAYRVALRKPWSSMWLKFAGFPVINLDDPMYSPVVSGQTRETYKTGIDAGIKF